MEIPIEVAYVHSKRRDEAKWWSAAKAPEHGISSTQRPAMSTLTGSTASPTKKKKKNKGNRHVYITERVRYLNFDVPSVDTVIEEDKLTKKLNKAIEAGDWKAQAHALLQLGQLMKWKGKLEIGEDFLARSAAILRDHTFADEENDDGDQE